MPRVSKKEVVAEVIQKVVDPVETPSAEKAVLPMLPPGQKYFEAPDGEILVGEASADRLWYRKMHNGQGGWINPKR